jgi:CHAT domain-containing protein/tetratricopeptide (TPR) repeat protein
MEPKQLRLMGASTIVLFLGVLLFANLRAIPIFPYRGGSPGQRTAGSLRWAGGKYLAGDSPLPGVPALSRIAKKASKDYVAGSDPNLTADMALLAWIDKKPEVARKTLEKGLRAFPRSGILLNDLAAVLMAEADSGDPSNLIPALAAIEESLSADSSLAAAYFNRALILEKLFLRTQSLREWRRYLVKEPKVFWLDIARTHLKNQNSRRFNEEWSDAQHTLKNAALANRSEDISRLVSRFPQSARLFAQEDLLGSWARATLDGRKGDAADYLHVALETGVALARYNADYSVVDAVSEIDRTLGGIQSTVSARAYLDLKEGLRLYKALEPQQAYLFLARARDSFSSTGSDSARLWADLWLAGCQYYQGNRVQAEREISALLLDPKLERYPALKARALWASGLMKMVEARFDSALSDLRTACAHYDRLGETENAGSVETLIAESFRFLGEEREAWRYRLRALERLQSFPSSVRLHNLLLEATYNLIFIGKPQLALYFSDEDVSVTTQSERPATRAEAWLGHSRALFSLGHTQQAFRDLREARRSIAVVSEESVRQRMIAEANMAVGGFSRREVDAYQIEALSDAINYYESRKIGALAAYGRLLRARSLMEIGDDLRAEQDLESALLEYEKTLGDIDNFRVRVTYREQWQEVFDDIVSLQVANGAPMKALNFLESARLGSEGLVPIFKLEDCSSCSSNKSSLSIIPPGATVVEYSLTKDRLLIWLLQRGGTSFISMEVNAERLTNIINGLCNSLQLGYSYRAGKQAQILFDLLIRPTLKLAPNTTRLVIVPDRTIRRVPFSALRDGETGLLLIEEEATIEYSTSASRFFESLLIASRQESESRENWRLLAVGNPALNRSDHPGLSNLPAAETEVKSVASLYPKSTVLLGYAATRKAVLAALDRADVFHFAGHATFNDTDPYMSRLFLAPEEMKKEEKGADLLYAYELRNRFKKAKLFIFSACETSRVIGIGRIGGGGIAEALLETRNRAVLAAQWKVTDEGTREMLREFHVQLLAGKPMARALQLAQRRALEVGPKAGQNAWGWAAFSLYGDINAK